MLYACGCLVIGIQVISGVIGAVGLADARKYGGRAGIVLSRDELCQLQCPTSPYQIRGRTCRCGTGLLSCYRLTDLPSAISGRPPNPHHTLHNSAYLQYNSCRCTGFIAYYSCAHACQMQMLTWHVMVYQGTACTSGTRKATTCQPRARAPRRAQQSSTSMRAATPTSSSALQTSLLHGTLAVLMLTSPQKWLAPSSGCPCARPARPQTVASAGCVQAPFAII